MVTELQFNIFRSLYDEELQRTNDLRSLGQIHLGACTFLLGGLLFKYKDLIQNINGFFESGILYIAFLFLALANITTLLSLRIFRYEYFSYPRPMFEIYGEKQPEDEKFLDYRIADLTVAFERNHAVNDGRAKLLNISSILLIVGTTLIFMIFLLVLK